MKFYVFAGDRYYPNGGAEDFLGAFDTIEEAHVAGAKAAEVYGTCGWYHIADQNMKIVWSADL